MNSDDWDEGGGGEFGSAAMHWRPTVIPGDEVGLPSTTPFPRPPDPSGPPEPYIHPCYPGPGHELFHVPRPAAGAPRPAASCRPGLGWAGEGGGLGGGEGREVEEDGGEDRGVRQPPAAAETRGEETEELEEGLT